jgi:hypothetical protein
MESFDLESGTRIGAMNPPPTPPRRGAGRRGHTRFAVRRRHGIGGRFWHPSGVRFVFNVVPGVSLALNNGWQPSGLAPSAHLQVERHAPQRANHAEGFGDVEEPEECGGHGEQAQSAKSQIPKKPQAPNINAAREGRIERRHGVKRSPEGCQKLAGGRGAQ